MAQVAFLVFFKAFPDHRFIHGILRNFVGAHGLQKPDQIVLALLFQAAADSMADIMGIDGDQLLQPFNIGFFLLV